MGLSLNRGSGNEKVARVTDVLLGNSLRNRLCALKLRPGIEVPAVLAGSQIRSAFRASALEPDLNGGRDDGPAHSAPQNLLKTRHMHGPRSVPLLAFRGTGFRFSRAGHTLAAVVLISTLSVFPFGHLCLTTSVK